MPEQQKYLFCHWHAFKSSMSFLKHSQCWHSLHPQDKPSLQGTVSSQNNLWMMQEANERNKNYPTPLYQLYQQVGKSIIDIAILKHNKIFLQNQHAI